MAPDPSCTRVLACLPGSVLHCLCWNVFLKSLASKDSIISLLFLNGFQLGLQWKALAERGKGRRDIRVFWLCFPWACALTLHSYSSSVFSTFISSSNTVFLPSPFGLGSPHPVPLSPVASHCEHQPPLCHALTLPTICEQSLHSSLFGLNTTSCC